MRKAPRSEELQKLLLEHNPVGKIWTKEELKKATWDILDNAGQIGVIIGDDCTVPNDIDDDRFNWVRDAAAEYAEAHK